MDDRRLNHPATAASLRYFEGRALDHTRDPLVIGHVISGRSAFPTSILRAETLCLSTGSNPDGVPTRLMMTMMNIMRHVISMQKQDKACRGHQGCFIGLDLQLAGSLLRLQDPVWSLFHRVNLWFPFCNGFCLLRLYCFDTSLTFYRTRLTQSCSKNLARIF